ncbi:MAG: DUF4011 domain-containing protein [Acidimicrobiia bacterium]|nr:DUF4011 domain-containing protein [Acidimicrobiia bacterium]
MKRTREQLEQWRKELIDLTKRNNLLHLPLGRRANLIRIVEPSAEEVLARIEGSNRYWRFHYPEPPPSAAANADGDDAGIALEDPDHSVERSNDELLTDVATSKELSKRLHSLERKAATEYNDKGLRILYLGAGLLRWRDGGEEQVSPLVLVPVDIFRPNPREPFRLSSTDDDSVFNPALTVKLAEDLGIDLPTIDPADGLNAVIGEVKAAVAAEPSWSVTPELVLGIFSFHKEVMYRDLLDNESAVVSHPMVQALAADPVATVDFSFEPTPLEELDDVAPPETLSSFLDADSTQRQCILAAREGKSFVIAGPPGTGKSQTIANTIAELLADSKTVLFVSEKAAALEVVQKRLAAAGLGSYVLELHSNRATRKEVAAALARELHERPKVPPELEPRTLRDAAKLRERLGAYAAAQNEIRRPFGRPLHWAIGRTARLDPCPNAPIPDGIGLYLSAEDFEDMVDQARSLASAWTVVEEGAEFLWRDLATPDATQQQMNALKAELGRASQDLAALVDLAAHMAVTVGLEPPRTLIDADRLAEIASLVESRPTVPAEWLYGQLDQVEDRLAELGLVAHAHERCSEVLCELGAAEATIEAPDLERLRAARMGLAANEPELVVDLDWDLAVLAGRVDFLGWCRVQIDTIADHAASLAQTLDLAGPATMTGVAALIELAELGAEPVRPEAWWFDESALNRAETSLRALQPMLEQYRDLHAQLVTVFNEQIAVLDIESFFDGPSDLSPKLSRLTSTGRRNRRQLKACTLSGDITDDAVAKLPIIRQWRAVSAELEDWSEVGSESFGSHYFQSVAPDVAALEQALSVAQRAIELTRTTGRSEFLAEQLSRDSAKAAEVAGEARRLRELVEQFTSTVEAHLGSTAPTLLGMPLVGIGSWIDSVRPHAAVLADIVQRLSTTTHIGTVRQAETVLHAYAEREGLVEQLAGAAEHDQALLGPLYVGLASDWSGFREALEWATSTRSAFGGACTRAQAEAVLTCTVASADLARALETYRKDVRKVADLFQPEYAAQIVADLDQFSDAAELFDALESSVGQIDSWVTFESARNALVAHGLGDVVGHLIESRADASSVAPTVESVVLRAWIDALLGSDERCRPLLAVDRNMLVDRFRKLDREVVRNGVSRAIAAANALRPSQAIGEAAIIKLEGEKRSRHRPIKTLLSEAGAAAQQLKPCFMMSPMSVSQFLPSDLRFDVVIFDEASQVRPSDAINAVYRGSQLLVAGDKHQLPPTSFFDRMTDDRGDEYQEDELDTFESVLDLCRSAAGVAELPLQWHYRSRHESLITYSNRSFYGNKLVTYPGAQEVAGDLGVELFYIEDGRYDRGGARDNPVEARAVVDRVLHHAEEHPNLTVGVVAFSEAQASRISAELEAVRRDRPDLDHYFRADRLDGFFIKNLESVQGDERDVIIFSVGYGPDETGKLSMNFGPINKEGGQRRLNVAITRAKRRVEVVASLRARDLRETTSAGLKHFKGYLDYAERGAVALPAVEVDHDTEPESPFEEAVLDVVRSWGHDVVPQVGQAGYRIDLAVRHPNEPGRFVLGIECDGAAYHSSAVARDRDRLRQEVLEGLGWRLHRIWGPSWYRDQPGEERRLQAAIADALAERPHQVVAGPEALPEVEVEAFDIDAQPEWVEDYATAELSIHWGKSGFAALKDRPQLERDIDTVVSAEGPVLEEVVLERLREPWRVQRMAKTLRNAFAETVDAMVAKGKLVRPSAGVLATPQTDLARVRRPTTGYLRKVTDVPPSELRAALVGVIDDGTKVQHDELTRRVAQIFGWGRRGSDITAALDNCLDAAVADGQLKRLADGSYEQGSDS